MPDFLSIEWIAGLDAAAKADAQLRDAGRDVRIVLQQTVTGAPVGDVTFQVVVDHGDVQVELGETVEPDVVFTQDYATARAIATSELSAQAAFMLGKLRIGGTVAKLIEHRAVFDGLDDLFAEVRAATTY